SSRADRSRSRCRDTSSCAAPLSPAAFSRDASSLAFVASAVWMRIPLDVAQHSEMISPTIPI
ncbi:hypothetical protein, partial [Klebsiella pneumoniae]|uniref:hypothetical protein n=1 Tax=Klebsiella pneumoniae TaxID=573 RepID=UPI00197AE260